MGGACERRSPWRGRSSSSPPPTPPSERPGCAATTTNWRVNSVVGLLHRLASAVTGHLAHVMTHAVRDQPVLPKGQHTTAFSRCRREGALTRTQLALQRAPQGRGRQRKRPRAQTRAPGRCPSARRERLAPGSTDRRTRNWGRAARQRASEASRPPSSAHGGPANHLRHGDALHRPLRALGYLFAQEARGCHGPDARTAAARASRRLRRQGRASHPRSSSDLLLLATRSRLLLGPTLTWPASARRWAGSRQGAHAGAGSRP